MTAPLRKNTLPYYTNEPLAEFMQTVQLNYNLQQTFMPWADVHQKDILGFTALYWAISHHNMHNLTLLMQHGSTLEVSAEKNALFYAIDCDALDALKYFIDKGIDKTISYTNPEGKSYTLLEHAKALKRKEIVEYLK